MGRPWPILDSTSTTSARWSPEAVGRLSRADRSRDPVRVGALLRSLGRHCATEAKRSTLAADAGAADGSLDDRTVTDDLQALERSMVIENQPAWAPQKRPGSHGRFCGAIV